MFANYLDKLELKLSQSFNIEKNVSILAESIDLFATMEMQNEKYFASKNVKLWRAEIYEYLFAKQVEQVDEKLLLSFTSFLQKAVDEYVKPHSEHMRSIITGVLVTEDEPDNDLVKKLRAFSFRKNFKFTLQGWAEIRLILVVPSKNLVFTNRLGKEVVEFYYPEKRQKGGFIALKGLWKPNRY